MIQVSAFHSMLNHTICPFLAFFFISSISFLSCICREFLSRSISLMDLSINLLFSLSISASRNVMIVRIGFHVRSLISCRGIQTSLSRSNNPYSKV